jgi:dTDP-4-dehydrorhamnose 3,5-epimerase-like enzyme
MKLSRIEDTDRGWFVGNFTKAAFQTEACEVSYKFHTKGEHWPLHYQEKITEINLMVSGEMIMQGQKLVTGDIFIIYPYEIADPEFLTDCGIVCVKVPGIQNDKVVVKKVT